MTTPALAIDQSLRPVAVDERIDLVDVVRGFALYGVLLANLVWITTDVVLTESHMAALPTAPLDRIVKPLVVFFVDHKFYTLFSFLFGLGFAIQLSRAEQRGRGIAMTYARRVAILALIGLAHIVFVWYGDILVFLFHAGSAWRGRLGYLAPVGRMALTNYLTHSVLYLALFSGVGLGLYGAVGPALCVVLSIAIFTAQMIFSRWWLARYRFGPAEWIWRTLTYGQGQPMTLIGK